MVNTDNANIYDSIASTVAPATREDSDYTGSDGLLYCGKCQEPKEKRITLCGRDMIVPIACRCKREQVAADEADRLKREAREYSLAFANEISADTSYLRCTFADDDEANRKQSALAKAYADNWSRMRRENQGLMFCGSVGTGKTFLAACIANAVMDTGTPVIMTSVPTLITAMQRNFEEDKPELLRRISNVPLLILDDVGIERDTSYGYEKFQEIIDARYKAQKPLIVTTNLKLSDLHRPKDIRYARIYDRLTERCCAVVMNGESRRKKKSLENRRKLEEMLGISL